uniref:Transmembrane protein 135 N-terminal domain-containing protein n=1 Tax=Panagrolaimus superbus TaxID=310955 RepID=A0A914YAT6_9BILA
MSVLSKLFANSFQLPILEANCYETIHVWNPSCSGALIDVIPQGLKFCLKTYGLFYLISGLIKKGDPRKLDYVRLIKDIIRSSVFLTMNMLILLYSMCWFRNRLGFFTLPTVSFVATILASFLAILIENPKRRPMLALYLTNLASETLYRQLVNHGYLRFIKNGESIVFAAGLAMSTYFYQRYGEKAGELCKLMKFTHHLDNNAEVFDLRKMPRNARLWLNILRKNFVKHRICEHRHSCLSVALESGLRNFGYGLVASLALSLIKSVRTPSKVLKNIFNSEVLKMPAFFASMPMIYHGVECSLNRILGRKTNVTPIAAGAASGAAMILYPSTSIAMYALWKGFEMIYFKAADDGLAPKFKYGDILLYALSTGFVLGNVIIEPQAIRKGYLNFLRGLTDNKLDLFNRRLFTKFGFDSNLLYINYVPNLDLRYVTLNPAHYLPQIKPL